jgi:hypothetical protein
MPFGKRDVSLYEEPLLADKKNFNREFMHFGKRVAQPFARDFMNFGKRFVFLLSGVLGELLVKKVCSGNLNSKN